MLDGRGLIRRRAGARLWLSGLWLALFVLAAVLAPLVSPQDPLAQDLMLERLPPAWVAGSEPGYWLGTDSLGRDVLSRIIHGARVALAVALVAGLATCLIGSALGLIAAYVGGRIETFLMRLVDLQLSFPAILVALMILAFLGKGVLNVTLALVIVEWARYARTARSAALVERRREYIEAAECLALPRWRVLFRHLLPNCLPPLIVIGTIQVARAITLEATLSFLGLGVPITEPSLGLLIANGYQYMLSGKYWISFYPGIALLVTIVAINLVGDHLRDVMNPRLKR